MTLTNLDNFAAFILTHGRPDNVITYKTLRRSGYTGKIYVIIDNEDKTASQYKEKYGGEVIVFDKKAISETFDEGDNFGDRRAIIYARNVSFEIAKKLGIKYFIQLDDDYTSFQHRFNREFIYAPRGIKNIDAIFGALLKFYINTNIAAVALAQGGDFIGGEGIPGAQKIKLKRKCMNSFICSTERPFQFVGRINEDVNTYTRLASTGLLLFTTNQATLGQLQTQSNSGGMTDLYLDSGTYVKSFYSIMYHPSSVTIKMMRSKHSRLHHSVKWINTVPLILSEDLKKK
jgi:hypothetical protein